MHLKTLKVFCDVVRRRSFSRAADDNEISQSGASQLVHQLEERLGVKLIDRSKRPFILTPEGQVYYEGCRGLVQDYAALEESVRTMHRDVAGRVRVAAIYSVGLHHMNKVVQSFLTRYPKSNVRIEYLHPHRVYEAVERETADLGLVSYPRSARSFESLDWREEPLVAVCAPDHPLAGRDRLSIDELHGLDFISFDPDLAIRRHFDRLLHQYHVEVSVRSEFDNIETIKRAVEINLGVSILPLPTITREIETGTLRGIPFSDAHLVRPLGIVYRRGRELSVAARRFIELLRTEDPALTGGAAASSGERPADATGLPAAGPLAAVEAEAMADGTAAARPKPAGAETSPSRASA